VSLAFLAANSLVCYKNCLFGNAFLDRLLEWIIYLGFFIVFILYIIYTEKLVGVPYSSIFYMYLASVS
jgi:hypothetical protein